MPPWKELELSVKAHVAFELGAHLFGSRVGLWWQTNMTRGLISDAPPCTHGDAISAQIPHIQLRNHPFGSQDV